MYRQIDLFSGEPVPNDLLAAQKKRRPRRENGSTTGFQQIAESVASLEERMTRLESIVTELCELVRDRKIVKESYTTQEVAKILDKKPYTVREWCRLQRVNAFKALCGRGCEEEWRISHDELMRIQNEGLLPVPEHY